MKKSEIPKIGLTILTGVAPIPGLSLLLNKRVRRGVRRAAGLALIGAGALVTVPLALYVICKTSPKSKRDNA